MFTYPTKILETLNVDVLKALARKMDLPKSLTRKADLIEEMARKVENDLQGVLNYMPNAELLLLAEAAFHNGRINPSVFSSKYGIPAPLPNPWMRSDQAVLTALMFQRNTLNIYEVPKELIKALLDFPALVAGAAEALEPHRLASYLLETARLVHLWYHKHHVLNEPPEITAARLVLARASRIVIRNGLMILGISAPDRM